MPNRMLSFVKKSIKIRIFLGILLPLAIVEFVLVYLHIKNAKIEFIQRYQKNAVTISSPFIKHIEKKLAIIENIENQKQFLTVYLDLKGQIDFPKWLASYENLLKVAVVDETGKLIAGMSSDGGITDDDVNQAGVIRSSDRSDGRVSISVPLRANGHDMGYFMFWFSDNEIVEGERRALLWISWILFFSMTAGSIISWLISAAITRPINQLTSDSRKISAGDLDHDIRSLKSMDEIGTLARSFRSMQGSIRRKLTEVSNQNIALEKEISDRKQAQSDLKKSEERYRLIADNVADIIWTMDANYRFTYISPSVFQLTGYTAEEMMQLPLSNILPEEAIEKTVSLNKRKLALIAKNDPLGWEPVIFEIEQICKGGNRIWTSNNARILSGPDKKPVQILGITRDITEHKRTQEIMVQSEKMMSVGGLAAGMAHEINNPLAGMMQTANVINNRLTSTDMPANVRVAEEIGIRMDDIKTFMEKREIIQMLKVVNKSGQRMARIMKNMLSFARKGEAQVSSHALSTIFDNTLELAASDFDLKKHYDFKMMKIRKEYDDTVPPVPCEKSKIQQVMLNILRNGAQAMQEAQIENPMFTLRLYLKKEEGKACIEIEDNGPGMDKETLKRVFEPFFTTKPAGVGTGLGLSVSYFIITENHGGEMHVESSPGNGARFIICLPLEAKRPEMENNRTH